MSTNPPNPGWSPGPAADKLTIETPEQTSLDFIVAGIGSRFLALAFDVLIQGLVGILAAIGFGLSQLAIGRFVGNFGQWVAALLILFYFVLYFGYYALFEILWNGQTPGKRKVGIRVIKDSGRPLTPAESIGRNLMRIVDWLPFFYAVGLACAFFTRGNKRLGDLVVGSIVVRESSLSDLKPAWQPNSAGQAPLIPSLGPLGARQLSEEEYTLIESFLLRREALEAEVRSRMAEEVFRKIKPKLSLPNDRPLSAEKILEAVAYEHRSTGAYF